MRKHLVTMIFGFSILLLASSACGTQPSIAGNIAINSQKILPSRTSVDQKTPVLTLTLTRTPPIPIPPDQEKVTPTLMVESTAVVITSTTSPSPSQASRLSPENWKQWPVVPMVSQKAVAIYRQGLANGSNPNAFSKVGDCQNITNYFLGIYDDPKKYRLGTYESLQPVIDQFKGSFSRNSLAVKGGFNVAAVLNPFYTDLAICDKNETPLACEIRINKPSIVIISMETWWAKRPASTYEKYLRQIVDFSIQHGALPILATKADNLEGDDSINATIARVASDEDLPLWNFWLAVQPLPYHGLTPEDPDHFHLTGIKSHNFFDDAQMMQTAWPVRNLTALQVLNQVWRSVTNQ